MASVAYNQFVARVKADGGRVTVAPSGRPASAYPMEVWTAKTNARQWPFPNEYSRDGRTGYYHVPAAIEQEIRNFREATDSEIKQGADALMEKWKGTWWGGMLESVKNVAGIILIAGVIYLAVTSKSSYRSVD